MIDIKSIIKNKEKIIYSCKSREIDFDVDLLIKTYEKIIKNKKILENLKCEKNKINEKINLAKKNKKDAKALIKDNQEKNKKINLLEEKYKDLEKKYEDLMYEVPNWLHENVPISKTDRVDWESEIEKPKFDFNPKSNWDILTELNLADFKKGINAAGDRGWVLKGNGARLSRAITNFILDFWREKKYYELIPPYYVNEENLYITGHYPGGENEVYKTEDGKVFVGTGEISVLAIFKNSLFNKKELPKKYMCYTPCFRREAGTHADDKGLYRTHQFDKVELTHITTPENEEIEFNKIIDDIKELYEQLELPCRIITHRANDMPNKAILEKDVEIWLAAEKRWGEAGSIGMTAQFQAKRGNIKYMDDGQKTYTHTIYATGGVANRILIAIINNFQNKDNTINIPKILIPYMGNIKKLEKEEY